jgi:hypothetical protein
MKYYYVVCLQLVLLCCTSLTMGQTATVYRKGSIVGTYTSLSAASVAANVPGDTIVLSAHRFKEHDVKIYRGQFWLGTYTATDSTIIDAQRRGRIFEMVKPVDPPKHGEIKIASVRDIIFENGWYVGDGGGLKGIDGNGRLVLEGKCIVRYCHAARNGGGVYEASFRDSVQLLYNTADSAGGGGFSVEFFGSCLVAHNKAKYGGGLAGAREEADLVFQTSGTRIMYNEATVAGGGLHGRMLGVGCDVMYNKAPRGAGASVLRSRDEPILPIHGMNMTNSHFYNPLPDGSRQNEIYVNELAYVYIDGCWFGSNDTAGLISGTPSEAWYFYPGQDYAVSHWQFNNGVAPKKGDTLLPVSTWFTYSDGKPLKKGALSWMQGSSYTASLGRFLDETPRIDLDDTLRGWYLSYAYAKGDTGSKPVSFTCVIDADTFRGTYAIWGRDSLSSVSIAAVSLPQIKVYPNPAHQYIEVSGAYLGMAYTITDITGKEVVRAALSPDNRIEVGGLPRGVYTLQLYDGNGNRAITRVALE